MNKEKDFFKTCFNTVAGLEVKNESQAIAKEVVLSEIENLQQENKILKENAENNDKVVDKVNWENMLLKKENEQLKDNWKKLKESIRKSLEAIDTIQKLTGNAIENYTPRILTYNQIKDKMQELEQGSDSNEY